MVIERARLMILVGMGERKTFQLSEPALSEDRERRIDNTSSDLTVFAGPYRWHVLQVACRKSSNLQVKGTSREV